VDADRRQDPHDPGSAREPLLGVPLYVTARGLTTSAIPLSERNLEVEFDFIEHALHFRTSDGDTRRMALAPRSVADFYAEYTRHLRDLNIACHFRPVPVEVPDPIPFEQDTQHSSYDPVAAHTFWQVLLRIDIALKKFRARFTGKQSPVHFWWGSFDISVTRFSGKPAPPRPKDPKFMQEAYSHEEISVGWWPGNGGFGEAAFYAYMVPPPGGFPTQTISPPSAYWDSKLGEFLLKYDDVRRSDDPEAMILAFCESVYNACARLAGWDMTAFSLPPSSTHSPDDPH